MTMTGYDELAPDQPLDLIDQSHGGLDWRPDDEWLDISSREG
jgi:hypothetical protein